MTVKDIYSIKFDNVVGKEMSLDEFKGKKILVVNVASYCGYTRQYKDLQILHGLLRHFCWRSLLP